MRAEHLEIHVEEPSMEAFLRELLPRLLGQKATFEVYPYQCKNDLLNKLQARLRGYARWLPQNWRIVIVIDRDDTECLALKKRMEQITRDAGLSSRSSAGPIVWQVANRIAIEELEAWYFGDWDAVRATYPRVPSSIPHRASFRDSDDIQGGTWEAFERILKRAGYFKSGLRKMEVARALGTHIDPTRSRSHSFVVFRDVLLEAVA